MCRVCCLQTFSRRIDTSAFGTEVSYSFSRHFKTDFFRHHAGLWRESAVGCDERRNAIRFPPHFFCSSFGVLSLGRPVLFPSVACSALCLYPCGSCVGLSTHGVHSTLLVSMFAVFTLWCALVSSFFSPLLCVEEIRCSGWYLSYVSRRGEERGHSVYPWCGNDLLFCFTEREVWVCTRRSCRDWIRFTFVATCVLLSFCWGILCMRSGGTGQGQSATFCDSVLRVVCSDAFDFLVENENIYG